MSRAGFLAGKAARYGPRAVAVAKLARGPAEKAARQALERRKARRDALAYAEAVTDGTVLQVAWRGSRVWVVWSGPTPVAVYPAAVGEPAVPVPVDEAVRHVDLAKRRTPEQVWEPKPLGR